MNLRMCIKKFYVLAGVTIHFVIFMLLSVLGIIGEKLVSFSKKKIKTLLEKNDALYSIVDEEP